MLIDRLELVHVAVPMRRPFTSSVATIDRCEALLVRVRGEGLTGWGELVCDVTPSYGPEIIPAARVIVERFLAPAIVGKTFDSVPDALAAFGWVRGHQMAKAGLELALWDWWGKATHQSLAQCLGGQRTEVPVGVSVGLPSSAEALRDELLAFKAAGYRRFKLKVKPGWLEVPITTAREALGDELAIAIDANGSFRPTELATLGALSSAQLQFLEQPFAWDDLVDHAALKAHGAPPICLDESISNLASLRAAIALGSADVLNVKPGRVGGLLVAKACLEHAHAAGLATFVGGMLETAIGRAGNVALASLDAVTLPSDLSASSRYFEHDLATPFVLGPSSTLSVPTRPGLGVELDEAAIERFRV